MALTFIQGLPGSGKTERCLREIVARAGEPDQNQLIYLVPEQFSLQSEKNIVARLPNRAMTRVQVLSFQRLAYHIFAEQGRAPGKYIDDTGKSMLLRKIIYGLNTQLIFFARAVDKQGFMDQLCGAVSEFYRYNVKPEDLQTRLKSLPMQPDALLPKLNDLYLIFKNYVEYLEGRYISTDEILDLLSGRISGSSFLTSSEIWIDGFESFTPQELKVIAELMKKASSAVLTVTVNEKGNRYPGLNATDFFYETKHTVNKISRLASDNDVDINEPIYLPHTVRYPSFPEMRFFVEKYYIRNSSFTPASDNICVVPASDRYGEINTAAAGVLELLREKGYRCRDIAILTGDIAGYEKGITSIFGLYGIPVFIDVKTDILSHPLSEAIRAAVDIIVFNNSYESVFRFLKTDLTGMERNEIDMLENYVLAYGIKGYKWHLPSWYFGFGGENERFDRDEINRIRDRVVESIEPFSHDLSVDKKYCVRELATRVFDMLYGMKAAERIERWIAEAARSGDNWQARRHGQIWGKICGIFDKMVEILGDEQVSLKEFGKILDAGFLGTSMGIIPPSADQVIAGDLTRTRLPEIRALFILGANEGILPAPIEESGLVSDEERLLLKTVGIELGPDSKRRINEDQYLIYKAFGKPAEQLTISYCVADASGKSLRPSIIIGRLKKMFPELTESFSSGIKVTLPEPMLRQMGTLLRQHTGGREMDPANRAVYAWLAKNSPYDEKMNRLRSYILNAGEDERLSPESLRSLYGAEIITAASRIEKYIECPFAYFMQYNLNAGERKVYRVGAADLGSLFHSVLERFSALLTEQGFTWRSVPRDRLDELVDHCVEEIAPQMGDSVLLSTARYQYTIERVRRVCKRSVWALWEHVQRGLFEPSASELVFKSGSPLTGISVNLNDRQRLVLTGRIDRVDIMDTGGNRYVKIIDYKSGNMKFDLSDVYFGMQMQLMLYLDAMIKNSSEFFPESEQNWEILPGGVFYFNINDPIVDIDDGIADDKLEDMLLKTFKMSGLVLAEDEVVQGLDKEIKGDSVIVPVMVKNSGELGSRSSVMDIEGFKRLREHVVAKMKETGNEMVSGNIAPYPFKKGQRTGCDYCGYGAVCGFELKEKKGGYNIVRNGAQADAER